MSMFKVFKLGAKNHPGNPLYCMMLVGIWLSAFMNKDVNGGLIAASVFSILLGFLYITTSVSVGRENYRDEED